MTRRLALLDVDGTLTEVKSVWQHLLEHFGRWTGEGEVNLARFQAGEISYAEFCRLDAELLRGLGYDDLCRAALDIPLRPGAAALFAALREHGYTVGLISTGLRVLTRRIEEEFAVDFCVVNDLAVAEGRCTGEATLALAEHEKDVHAREAIKRYGSDHVVAIGDSAGDLCMFREATVSILVGECDPRIAAQADVHLPDGDLSHAVAWL